MPERRMTFPEKWKLILDRFFGIRYNYQAFGWLAQLVRVLA